jgi:ABC-type multidrug transport system fused ATPase/permease subunit
VPFIIIAGAVQLRIFTSHAAKTKKDLEMAGKLAVDSIDNIRTVAALTIEDKFSTLYSAEVTRTYKKSVTVHPISYGITYSLSQAIIYIMYAVVFRFGAFLVIQDPNSILFVEFQDVFRVFMAVIFGALSVGQASSFAPNYAKAKLSANRIFAILDRKPVIDNYSEEGEKPVSSVKRGGVHGSCGRGCL